MEILVEEKDKERTPPFLTCRIDGEVQFRSDYPPGLVAAVAGAMYDGASRHIRDFLLLHAAAVTRSGQALLMPALPESGKSSLTLALLRTGAFQYLSDEFGAIDPVTGRLYPFERPIRVDEATLDHFEGLADEVLARTKGWPPDELAWRFFRAEDLGAGVSDPAPVRWIVHLSPDWEGPPRLTPVASAEAVAEMAKNAFNLGVYAERAVHLLARVAKGTTALRLTGGTPEERAELLAGSLD